MKKIIYLIVLIFLLGLNPIITEGMAEPNEEAPTPVKNMNKFGHVAVAKTIYQSASTSSKPLLKINKNKSVYIYSEQDNWYKVRVGNTKGYITKKNINDGKYVKPIKQTGYVLKIQTIYQQQDKGSKQLVKLTKNTNVYVHSLEDGWYRVRAEGVAGYIPRKNIKLGKYEAPKKKVIALTFDDGPNQKTTPQILNALKKYNGHATFFVIGNKVQSNAHIVKRAVKEGHEIGNHTWDHLYLTKLSGAEVKEQLNRAGKAIKQVTGVEPKIMRPPYGATNSYVDRVAGGLDTVLWDIDPQDWRYRDKNRIVNQVMSQAGDGKIILLHDIYQTSVDAAIEIIERLDKKDYQFVTVSELKKLRVAS